MFEITQNIGFFIDPIMYLQCDVPALNLIVRLEDNTECSVAHSFEQLVLSDFLAYVKTFCHVIPKTIFAFDLSAPSLSETKNERDL